MVRNWYFDFRNAKPVNGLSCLEFLETRRAFRDQILYPMILPRLVSLLDNHYQEGYNLSIPRPKVVSSKGMECLGRLALNQRFRGRQIKTKGKQNYDNEV